MKAKIKEYLGSVWWILEAFALAGLVGMLLAWGTIVYFATLATWTGLMK